MSRWLQRALGVSPDALSEHDEHAVANRHFAVVGDEYSRQRGTCGELECKRHEGEPDALQARHGPGRKG